MTSKPNWVRADEVKVGDILICDGSFDCLSHNALRIVRQDPDELDELNGLYVQCDEGRHLLSGQLGYTDATEGFLVGLSRIDVGA